MAGQAIEGKRLAMPWRVKQGRGVVLIGWNRNESEKNETKSDRYLLLTRDQPLNGTHRLSNRRMTTLTFRRPKTTLKLGSFVQVDNSKRTSEKFRLTSNC
jgi:hypothetical protein